MADRPRPPRCASIGGTDSAGAAGLAADLRTFAALGCHGSMIVTSVTVQSTTAVNRVHPLPPELVAEQLETVLRDPGVDALVLGLVPELEILERIAQVLGAWFERAQEAPVLVIDPIVLASTGERMGVAELPARLVEWLLPLATVATPNALELEALCGARLPDEAARIAAARRLLERGPGRRGGRGCQAILITGGEDEGDPVDLLVQPDGVTRLRVTRVRGAGTRGGGCTHAAALAVLLAEGRSLPEAAGLAQAYLAECAEAAIAPGLGEGRVVQVRPSWRAD